MSQLVLRKVSDIATPETDKISIYAKEDGGVYAKDDTGREILLSNSELSLFDHITASDPHPQYLKKTSSRRIEYVEITDEHIANKKIVLERTPLNPDFIQADVKNGGGALFLGEDFIVRGREFSWKDLELDGFIEKGDKIRLVYDSV